MYFSSMGWINPDPSVKNKGISLFLLLRADSMFLTQKNYRQRGERSMAQGILSFKYEEKKEKRDDSTDRDPALS